MSWNRMRRSLLLFLVACLVLLGSAPASLATTVCDTDPNKVNFTPTVDPSLINALLRALGNLQINETLGVPIPFDGLCATHQILANAGIVTLPVGTSPVMVTPSLGSLRVDLTVPGTFTAGVDGGTYSRTCDPSCEIPLPYIGDVVCDIESVFVGGILGLLEANATLSGIKLTQVADTCVLGNCTAVHPLELSDATIGFFDIDLIAGGSCDICSALPSELKFLCDPFGGTLDPCKALDGLIGNALKPSIENGIADALVTADGKGLLIEVFHSEIVADFFGCIPIPEVQRCRPQQPETAADLAPKNRGLNAVLYLLPLAPAGVLALRLRRRRN